MDKTVILMFVSLSCFSLSATAFEKNITCEPPQGTRVDYFLKNAVNVANDTFTMAKDRVSDAHPTLSFKTGEVVFSVTDTSMTKQAEVNTEVMKIIDENDEQISFTGTFSGAPILASYYPQMKILIYTQQSTWPGPDFQGARALMFYAKCTEDAPKNTITMKTLSPAAAELLRLIYRAMAF